MIKTNKRMAMLFLMAMLAGCAPTIVGTTPTEAISLPTSTSIPTPAPTQNDGVLLELPTPIPETIALDFAEKPCSASWSNNGEYLPCPGILDDIQSGYADRFDEIVISGGIHIKRPGLLTIPAQPGIGFYAIFGKYPPFTVMDGDRFQAILACMDGYPNCDAAVSLEYYNANGQVIEVPGAKWNVRSANPDAYIYADTDLSALAGHTVQFSLSVRDNGDSLEDRIVWIMPRITRVGGAATDAVSQ